MRFRNSIDQPLRDHRMPALIPMDISRNKMHADNTLGVITIDKVCEIVDEPNLIFVCEGLPKFDLTGILFRIFYMKRSRIYRYCHLDFIPSTKRKELFHIFFGQRQASSSPIVVNCFVRGPFGTFFKIVFIKRVHVYVI